MRRRAPLGVLLVLVLAISAVQIGYVATGATPSDTAALLTSVGLALAFILWMEADAHLRHQVPCHDFGFLVAVFFPISLLWYVFWSRGRLGVLVLLGLLGLMLLPLLSAVAASVLLYGLR
jgi:hypothetical protein